MDTGWIPAVVYPHEDGGGYDMGPECLLKGNVVRNRSKRSPPNRIMSFRPFQNHVIPHIFNGNLAVLPMDSRIRHVGHGGDGLLSSWKDLGTERLAYKKAFMLL